MDFNAVTIFLSRLLAGDLDQERIQTIYGDRTIGTFVLVAVAVLFLVVITAALSGWGAYVLWGRLMATFDAFGFSPSSRPDFPPVEEQPIEPPAAAPTLPTPDVTVPIDTTAPTTPTPATSDPVTEPPVTSDPKADPAAVPPPSEPPIPGSGTTP